MITFIVSVISILIAAGALISARRMRVTDNATLAKYRDNGFGRRPEARSVMIPVAVALTAFLLGISGIAFATIDHVPARNKGIVASYSKPTGRVTGPGLHVHAPWETIEDWDGTRQAFDRRTNNDCRLGDQKTAGVKVRIANLSDACVEAQVEWKSRDGRAPEQWASYRKDFNRFVDKRVTPAFTEAFNLAFSAHDPLVNIDAKDGKLNVPLAPFAKATQQAIQDQVGNDVEVLSVIVTRINYDPKTQAQIDQYQQAILKGRVLEKEKKNAELAKAVTETNAKVDKVTRCLELAKELSKEPGYCMWTNGFPAAK